MHTNAYFEPLLLKSRLGPLNPTEKLSYYMKVFVLSLFPPAAVIWKSCITILSLIPVLWSPSSHKEKMYWELLQNSISGIGFKLRLLFMSSGVAQSSLFTLALCIPLTLKPWCQEPITSIPSWTAGDNHHTNPLLVNFCSHQKQWDLQGITLRDGTGPYHSWFLKMH